MTLYRESNIDDAFQTSMEISGTQYCLCGDPAYCFRPYLQIGYRGSHLTLQQVQFNVAMSKVRISLEWAFRDLENVLYSRRRTKKAENTNNASRSMVCLRRYAMELVAK
jgi:hypothetical protein